MSGIREQFEEWAKRRELELTPNTGAFIEELPFADIVTQDHWNCWQAAYRAGAEAQLPDGKIESLTTFIAAWIKSQSGPHMTIWRRDLALKVSFRGWKKIILERDFKRAEAELGAAPIEGDQK